MKDELVKKKHNCDKHKKSNFVQLKTTFFKTAFWNSNYKYAKKENHWNLNTS